MPRDKEMKKLKVSQKRKEKSKTTKVENDSVVPVNDGNMKRRKREKVDSHDKAKRVNKDEKVSKKKKRHVEDDVKATDEEMSALGESETEGVAVNGVDQFEGASKSSSKNKKKKKSKKHTPPKEGKQMIQVATEAVEDDVLYMSSGDEDSSHGMKKWLTEYHDQRPGFEILQQRIDDFIVAHEEKLEQEKKEREARIAEDGWTVVEHHKGRKKTTDAESGITVGSVAQAAVLDNLAKKKQKGVGPDFYRFQKREAQRNQVIMLQQKFEEDKKRIQQQRAARKFRPY